MVSVATDLNSGNAGKLRQALLRVCKDFWKQFRNHNVFRKGTASAVP
jgi:hypothetical protein